MNTPTICKRCIGNAWISNPKHIYIHDLLYAFICEQLGFHPINISQFRLINFSLFSQKSSHMLVPIFPLNSEFFHWLDSIYTFYTFLLFNKKKLNRIDVVHFSTTYKKLSEFLYNVNTKSTSQVSVNAPFHRITWHCWSEA